jgi:sortase B
MAIVGIIPLAGLTWFDWVQIGGGNEAGGEAVEVGGEAIGISMMQFLFAPFTKWEWFGSEITTTLLDRTSSFTDEMAASFGVWYTVYGVIFMSLAVMMLFSFVYMVAAAFAGSGRARSSFAYCGFAVYTLSCLGFVIMIYMLNQQLEIETLRTTEFPFAALLAGLLAMIYCVRFPVLSDHSRQRNSIMTRAITTFVPVRGDGVREGIRKVIFTTALVCFVFFGTRLGAQYYELWRDARQKDALYELSQREGNINNPVFNNIRHYEPRYHLALVEENPDTRGFIQIGDTVLKYPVVQGPDNNFYLRRNFEGQSSVGGSIFADHRNRLSNGPDISRNTVLYGHSGARGNAYFTLVPRYFTTTRDNTLSFYKENPIIRFNTLFEQMQWKVFAVVLFNTQEELGHVVPYWSKHEFADADDFHDFIIDIMDRSVLHTETDITYGDHILTLSTCHFHFGKNRASTRVAVFARRLRPGESAASFDVNGAYRNRQTYYGDFQMAANSFGAGQRGVWDRHRLLLSYEGV